MTAPGYNGEGTRFPLTIVRGADMAFDLTATSGGLPLDLSGATIEPELYDISDNLVTSLTPVVSGVDSNVLTLSFARASATALSQSRYLWTLWVTRGGDRRPWFAGQVIVTNGRKGQGGATSGSYTVTVDGDVTVSVDVNGGAGGGGSSVTIQATAPSSPSVGDLWVDEDDLALYTYYDDGNSSQWVAIGGPAGPAGPAGSGSGDLLSTNNLSDVANASTARTNLGLAIGTNVQAYDADLAAIAALSTTAYGRAFLALVDIAALRTVLGPTGTPSASTFLRGDGSWATPSGGGGGDLLASNNLSELTATASTARTNLGLGNAATLTVDADLATLTLPASTTISAFGATLVDDADASTARTTLGVDYTTLDERTRDTIGTALVAGSNVTITPNDGADTITIAASGGGGSADPLTADFIISGRIFSR